MKKMFLISINILLVFILFGCKNYSGYEEVEIPDEKLGTIKIPNNWEIQVVDDWIHISEKDSNKTIGIQWYKGSYYMIGEETYDERYFNTFFEKYTLLNSSFISGNSNGSQWGRTNFSSENIDYEYRFLYFIGLSDSRYISEIVIIDNEIDDETLSNIAKSYKK